MPITVSNLTPIRSFNASAVSIDVLADALGTLIGDVQTDVYDGSQWSISNGDTNREVDVNNITIDNLADLIATLVADNPTEMNVWNITFEVLVVDDSLNCNMTSISELAKIICTFVALNSFRFCIAQLVSASTILRAFIGKRFPPGLVQDIFRAVPRHLKFEAIDKNR